MSWRHTQAVITLDLGKPALCAVLLILAHHANEFTGVCWPSMKRMRAGTGLGESTIQRALTELIRLKLISRKVGGGKTSNIYTLHLPDADAIEQGNPPRREGAPPPERGPTPPRAGGEYKKKDNRIRPEDERPDLIGSPLPEDWRPTPAMIAQAKDDYPDVDLEHETLLFIDVNQRDGTLGRNWNAAWRAWIGRAKSFGPGRRRGGGGTGSGADRLRARARAEDGRPH